MQRFGLFDETETLLLHKCFLFYAAIRSEAVPEQLDLTMCCHLRDILTPEPQELVFRDAFRRQESRPKLLFPDAEIREPIPTHPMAMRKCGKRK